MIERKQKEHKNENKKQNPYYIPVENATAYPKETKLEVKIIKMETHFSVKGEKYIVVLMKDEEGSVFKKSLNNINAKFEKDLKRKQKKNPSIKFKDLEVGMKTQIHIKEDVTLNSTEVKFTVLPVIENH